MNPVDELKDVSDSDKNMFDWLSTALDLVKQYPVQTAVIATVIVSIIGISLLLHSNWANNPDGQFISQIEVTEEPGGGGESGISGLEGNFAQTQLNADEVTTPDEKRQEIFAEINSLTANGVNNSVIACSRAALLLDLSLLEYNQGNFEAAARHAANAGNAAPADNMWEDDLQLAIDAMESEGGFASSVSFYQSLYNSRSGYGSEGVCADIINEQ